MATAVWAPACTAELMGIGPSHHEPPGASMLVLSDKSARSTWSAGFINTLSTQVYYMHYIYILYYNINYVHILVA